MSKASTTTKLASAGLAIAILAVLTTAAGRRLPVQAHRHDRNGYGQAHKGYRPSLGKGGLDSQGQIKARPALVAVEHREERVDLV